MQFDLIEKNLSCATIPNFLYKVAYNSEAIIISCVVFVIWNQSLSHVAGKRKNKQPVFLNPLPLDFCTGKFTDWFSLGSSYCDQVPHNLIQDHWMEQGSQRKPHKMFEQGTRWQYISFHSCCMQCARVRFSGRKNRVRQRIHKGVTFELKHEGIQRCIMFIFGGQHHGFSGKKSSFQQIQSLGLEDPTEKEMATLSSLLAWETPWTEDESDTTW